MVCVRKEGITFVLVFGLFIIKRNEALSSHGGQNESPFAAAFSHIFNAATGSKNSRSIDNDVDNSNNNKPQSFMDIFQPSVPLVLVKKRPNLFHPSTPKPLLEATAEPMAEVFATRDSLGWVEGGRGASKITRWPPPRSEVSLPTVPTNEVSVQHSSVARRTFVPQQIDAGVSSRGELTESEQQYPKLVPISESVISERSYSYDPPADSQPRLTYERRRERPSANSFALNREKPTSTSYQTFTLGKVDMTTTPETIVYHDATTEQFGGGGGSPERDSYGSPLGEVLLERPPRPSYAEPQDEEIQKLPIETLFQTASPIPAGYARGRKPTAKPFRPRLPPPKEVTPNPFLRKEPPVEEHPEYIPVMIMVPNPAFSGEKGGSVASLPNSYSLFKGPSVAATHPTEGSTKTSTSYSPPSTSTSQSSSYSPPEESTTFSNNADDALSPVPHASTDRVPIRSRPVNPRARQKKPANSEDGYGSPQAPVLTSNQAPISEKQNPFLTTEATTSTTTLNSSTHPTVNTIPDYSPPKVFKSSLSGSNGIIPTGYEAPKAPPPTNPIPTLPETTTQKQTIVHRVPPSTSAQTPVQTSFKIPVTSVKTPISSVKSPVMSVRTPVTSARTPVTSARTPVTSVRTPLVTYRSPATSQRATTSSKTKIASTKQRPVFSKPVSVPTSTVRSPPSTSSYSDPIPSPTEESINVVESENGLKVRVRGGEIESVKGVGVEQSINLSINVIVKADGAEVERATAEIHGEPKAKTVTGNIVPTLTRRKVVQAVSQQSPPVANPVIVSGPKTVPNSASIPSSKSVQNLPSFSSNASSKPVINLPSYSPPGSNNRVNSFPSQPSNNNLPSYGGNSGGSTANVSAISSNPASSTYRAPSSAVPTTVTTTTNRPATTSYSTVSTTSSSTYNVVPSSSVATTTTSRPSIVKTTTAAPTVATYTTSKPSNQNAQIFPSTTISANPTPAVHSTTSTGSAVPTISSTYSSALPSPNPTVPTSSYHQPLPALPQRYFVRKRKRPRKILRKKPSITFQDQLGPSYGGGNFRINHSGSPRPTANPSKQRSPTTPQYSINNTRLPTSPAFKALLANIGASYGPPPAPVQAVQNVRPHQQPVQPVSTTYSTTQKPVTTTTTSRPVTNSYRVTATPTVGPVTNSYKVTTPVTTARPITNSYKVTNRPTVNSYRVTTPSTSIRPQTSTIASYLSQYDPSASIKTPENSDDYRAPDVILEDYYGDAFEELYAYEYDDADIYQLYTYDDDDYSGYSAAVHQKGTTGGGGRFEESNGKFTANYPAPTTGDAASPQSPKQTAFGAAFGGHFRGQGYYQSSRRPKNFPSPTEDDFGDYGPPLTGAPGAKKPSHSYATVRTPSYSYSTANGPEKKIRLKLNKPPVPTVAPKFRYAPPSPPPPSSITPSYSIPQRPIKTHLIHESRPPIRPLPSPPSLYASPPQNNRYREKELFDLKDDLIPNLDEVAKNADWDVMDFTDWAKKIPSGPTKHQIQNYQIQNYQIQNHHQIHNIPRRPRFYEASDSPPIPVLKNPFEHEMPNLSIVESHPDTTTSFDELIRYKKPRRYLPVKLLQNRNDDGENTDRGIENVDRSDFEYSEEIFDENGEDYDAKTTAKTIPEFNIEFDDWLQKFGVKNNKKKNASDSGSISLSKPRKKRR